MDYEDFDGPPTMEVDHYDESRRVYDNEYEGCFMRFLRGMRGCWATKHTEDTEDNEELYVKTTLRELGVYLVFLVIQTIITFCMTNGLTYWYTNGLINLFTQATFPSGSGNLAGAAGMSDLWQFLSGPLLSGLYWSSFYNNLNLPSNEMNFIYYETMLIGLPRLRQVRVGNSSCQVPIDFNNLISECYAPYSSNMESTDPFGLMNSTAWTYTSAANIMGRPVDGQLATYNAGGYYVDLNQSMSDSANTINFLFNNLWTDRGTRAVFVDFTVYNANINLFSVVKFIIEFPGTGGLIASWQFRTVKLIRYVTPLDYFVMGCELVFLAFLIYYIVEEIIEIRKHKLSYFSSFWSILDIIVIAVGLLCTALNIYRTIAVQNLLQNLLNNPNIYPNFDFLSYYQLLFNYAFAFTLFFSWVKLFKYISFNKTMSQLSETLGRCAKDLLGFAVMFLIIFFAFAQLGYLLFGSQCVDYMAFNTTIYTLFRIILGDFNFMELQQADPLFGPLYFILYVFFVFFVLFNMFLAIINDTYSEVKADLTMQNENAMGNYFKQRANMMLEKLNIKRDKIIDIQGALFTADANNDNLLDFDEWKAELKARGYEEEEIEAMFSKYDTNGDRVIDLEERLKMLDELEKQKAALSTEISKTEDDSILQGSMNGGRMPHNVVSKEEYEVLAIRVDRMETTVNAVVNKIDGILQNIEKMEKSKSKRPQTMENMLNILTSDDQLNENERKKKLESLVTDEISKMNQESMVSLRGKTSHGHASNSQGKF